MSNIEWAHLRTVHNCTVARFSVTSLYQVQYVWVLSNLWSSSFLSSHLLQWKVTIELTKHPFLWWVVRALSDAGRNRARLPPSVKHREQASRIACLCYEYKCYQALVFPVISDEAHYRAERERERRQKRGRDSTRTPAVGSSQAVWVEEGQGFLRVLSPRGSVAAPRDWQARCCLYIGWPSWLKMQHVDGGVRGAGACWAGDKSSRGATSWSLSPPVHLPRLRLHSEEEHYPASTDYTQLMGR